MQAIKKSASFFNTVRQSIFYLKPNGFDSRKANVYKFIIPHNQKNVNIQPVFLPFIDTELKK